MSNIDMPAYPSAISASPDGGYFESSCWGLTKLEAFTLAAMQGLCGNPAVYETVAEFSPDGAALTVALAAHRIARATLAELEVKTP